jgi:hypothetical protein
MFADWISKQYVAVLYANTPDFVTYEKKQCYPYTLNGNLAQMAVFCEEVTCYNMM